MRVSTRSTYFPTNTPTKDNIQHFDAIHVAAKHYARVILDNTPPGPDQGRGASALARGDHDRQRRRCARGSAHALTIAIRWRRRRSSASCPWICSAVWSWS